MSLSEVGIPKPKGLQDANGPEETKGNLQSQDGWGQGTTGKKAAWRTLDVNPKRKDGGK